MTTSTDHGTKRAGPRAFFALPGFRRLVFSRFAVQWADGVFRAGLAGAVLFNPERGADPLTIAGGFATLLLPYSLVGPFAGALLDRWDRRRVLVLANLLRGLAVLATCAAVALGAGGTGLFALALLAEGISRFVGSGLSASLPHVVDRADLVAANSVATTLGSMVAVLGGGCAIGLRALFGSDNTGSALATVVAVAGTTLAALIAARFGRGELGPDSADTGSAGTAPVGRQVAGGLAEGLRAALAAPRVTAGFLALFAHRASYSISLLLTVLLMRYYFTDLGPLRAGLPGLGQMALLAGLGIVLAGLLTPRLVARFGLPRSTVGALLLATAAQAGLGLPMLLPLALLASFVITASGQVLKLSVDAAVQTDVRDERRGRVFALYDTLFNITQVAAVAVAATVVRPDGYSPGLLLAATGLYLLGAGSYLITVRRSTRAVTGPGTDGPIA